MYFLVSGVFACAEAHAPKPVGTAPLPIIEVGGLPTVFNIPQSIGSEPFPVEYATFGSSSCSRHQAPDVVVEVGEVAIKPRLAPIPAGAACTDDLATVRHTAVLGYRGVSGTVVRLTLVGYRFDGTLVRLTKTTMIR